MDEVKKYIRDEQDNIVEKGIVWQGQELSDIQENTNAINRIGKAVWILVGVIMVLILIWGFTWWYFNHYNILWNIMQTC